MKTAAALLSFVSASTLAALVFGSIFSGLNAMTSWISLVLGAVVGVAAWRQVPVEQDCRPRGFFDWLILGIFVLVSLRIFLWLLYVRGDDLCVLTIYNLGDMALHLNFIRYLAAGAEIWPESPILTGAGLTYPLGADLFNAVWAMAGTDIPRSLVWTGLAGALLTGWMLWRWGGAFGVAAFLFNGGLAGLAFFQVGELKDFAAPLAWKSLFLTMLATQRGLLFALPAGLALLCAWRGAWFRNSPAMLPPWVQILLYTSLPVFNLHAFLFLSLILAAIFVSRPRFRRPVIVLVGSSFLPATILVLFVTQGGSAVPSLQWMPSWISGGQGWMSWFANFGFSLPLVAIVSSLLIFRPDSEARIFVWLPLSLFVFCALVSLQAWAWDNMKLMIWAWIVMAPYFWQKGIAPLPPWSRAVLCFFLFFSGALSLADGLGGKNGYALARRSHLAQWEVALREVPPNARIACEPEYNHPVILLGRKVACGYEGHLWSHGLDYQEKLAALRRLLARDDNWQDDARRLQVDWMIVRSTNSTQEVLLKIPKPDANPTSVRSADLTP